MSTVIDVETTKIRVLIKAVFWLFAIIYIIIKQTLKAK